MLKPGIKIKWDPHLGPVVLLSLYNKNIKLVICHRRKERSIRINGYTFPLCSRCTGILLGFFISLFLIIFRIEISLLIAIILCIPLLIDGFSQLLGWRKSNNTIRFLTGFIFGIAEIPLINQTLSLLY